MSHANPAVMAFCAPASGLVRHTRALRIAFIITATIMVAEAVGGWIANSLALLADAAHMLGDAAAIGLALFMATLARRPATPEKTYGYLRLEILAALVNGAVLLAIAGVIVWRAVGRLTDPAEVRAGIVLGVGAVGLVANVAALRVLHGGHRHSLNVRGAYLHVLSDLLGSIGTIAAGLIIVLTGWMTADPLISLGIAALILVSAFRLVRESVDVLLEGTPRHVALLDVHREIASVPGVTDVHDLHVWTVTSGMVAMTGHVVVPEAGSQQVVLETVRERMTALGIQHVTVQVERERICRL